MGLTEIMFAALCLNATCPNDDADNPSPMSIKKQNLLRLAEEIKNENLIITTLANHRLSFVENVNNTLIGGGVAFDILNILQRKFDFNYTIALPRTNVWGSQENGVLSVLKNKKAHMAAAFLPVISKYGTDITYSPSLDTGQWVVLMKRPKESATGSGLTAPFTLPVWILIFVSFIAVGPVIYIIIFIQSKLIKDDQCEKYPLPSCIWFVYGALLKQGSTLNPVTDTSRLLFSTWWIFITLLTAFYTANLTAFLTLSKFTLPINEAKDIGAKKSKWLTTKGNALEDTITTDGTTLSELGKLLGRPYDYVDLHDDLILTQFVEKKNMLFIRETPIVEYIMYDVYKNKTRQNIDEDKRCTYVITKFSVATFSRAFAYEKDFKYKDLFDTTLQSLVEAGVIKYKLREELPDTSICPLNLGSMERQLSNADLVLTYEIISGGFLLSAVVFILEMIIRRPIKTERKEEPVFKKVTSTNPNKHTFHINMNNNFEKFGQPPFAGKFITPPPGYNTLFNPIKDKEHLKKKNINGREYWVYDSLTGQTTMVPTRTPSALLFQFTN